MEIIWAVGNSFWFQAMIKLILGFILAGVIGLERSSWSKPAGFRTHALVGISSVLVMLCGEYLSRIYDMDPSRIPAQLLSGIGFIGAGTILRDGFNVKGLTTVAGLLSVTCIGLSIGAGFYLGGIVTTLIVYIILSYSYKISDKLDHFDILELDIKITKEMEDTLTAIEKNKKMTLVKQYTLWGTIIRKVLKRMNCYENWLPLKTLEKYYKRKNKGTF